MKDRDLIKDYKNTFLPEAGRRVLDDIKRISQFHNAVVARDNTGRYDSHEMARREGQRSVIIHIIKQIEKKL